MFVPVYYIASLDGREILVDALFIVLYAHRGGLVAARRASSTEQPRRRRRRWRWRRWHHGQPRRAQHGTRSAGGKGNYCLRNQLVEALPMNFYSQYKKAQPWQYLPIFEVINCIFAICLKICEYEGPYFIMLSFSVTKI